MEAAYGNDRRLRTGMTGLGLIYVAGVQSNTLVWPSCAGSRQGGKPLNNTGRRDEPDPISAKEVAFGLPKRARRTIRWREGLADWLSSRFARVRVGVGHNRLIPELLSQEWLVIEWPESESEPTKYWFSTLPADISFRQLVDFAKLRGRIERDYQELKQEVGLGHYEGRGFRHDVCRGLRIPDLRKGHDSPLRTSFHRAVPATCRSRGLPTQRIPVAA
jgi:SRSO17 transposase